MGDEVVDALTVGAPAHFVLVLFMFVFGKLSLVLIVDRRHRFECFRQPRVLLQGLLQVSLASVKLLVAPSRISLAHAATKLEMFQVLIHFFIP